MIDILPFLRLTEESSEKQIAEIVDYLIHFKETLEFALMNISTENFSPDLIEKLNALGADIEKSNMSREEEITQISQNQSLTISDVCNSEMFKNEVENNVSSLQFSVNFETGNLEYTIK